MKIKIPIIIALIALASFTVNAQKIKVAANPKADFSKFKTYTWDTATLANPIIKGYIIAAVDREMTAKGLQKVDSDADLLVTTVTAIGSDLTMTNPSWAPSLNSLATGIPDSPQAWTVTKGTLLIDITDARTKDGVWRGAATQTLENGPSGDRAKDAKMVEKPINKAVQKLFKKFPSKT